MRRKLKPDSFGPPATGSFCICSCAGQELTALRNVHQRGLRMKWLLEDKNQESQPTGSRAPIVSMFVT